MKLGPHTVTRLRAGFIVDRYGNETAERDWANAATLDITGCSVQPAPGGETTDRRDAITTRWNLWVPGTGVLLATDRVRWQGVDHDVDGEIGEWGFDPLAHTTASLKKVTG